MTNSREIIALLQYDVDAAALTKALIPTTHWVGRLGSPSLFELFLILDDCNDLCLVGVELNQSADTTLDLSHRRHIVSIADTAGARRIDGRFVRMIYYVGCWDCFIDCYNEIQSAVRSAVIDIALRYQYRISVY